MSMSMSMSIITLLAIIIISPPLLIISMPTMLPSMRIPILALTPLRILPSPKPAQQYPRRGAQAREYHVAYEGAGAGAEKGISVLAFSSLRFGAAMAVVSTI